MIGIKFETAILLTFILNGVWWLGMSTPLAKAYKQQYYVEVERKVVKSGFLRIWESLKDIKKEKHIFLFLLGFFFYIDGVYTTIDMATAYGEALGLDSTGLLLALLVTQIVAFPCALIFGRLSKKFKTQNLITICIVAYLGISVFAIFLSTQLEFWILAVCVGMFQGGIQALSRSYYTRIIPPEKSGEYFGLMDICGKGAAFIGTFMVSVITQVTNSASKGVAVISLLMVIGLIIFRYSISCSKVASHNS